MYMKGIKLGHENDGLKSNNEALKKQVERLERIEQEYEDKKKEFYQRFLDIR